MEKDTIGEFVIDWLGFAVMFGLIIGLVGLTSLSTVASPRPQVVSAQSNETLGEYNPDTFRGLRDQLFAGQRFVDHYVSLNGQSAEQDQFIALMMMSSTLRKQRLQHLADFPRIETARQADLVTHNEFEPAVIIAVDKEHIRVRYRGETVATGPVEQRIPFQMEVTLGMGNVSPFNPTGVPVEGYHEF